MSSSKEQNASMKWEDKLSQAMQWIKQIQPTKTFTKRKQEGYVFCLYTTHAPAIWYIYKFIKSITTIVKLQLKAMQGPKVE